MPGPYWCIRLTTRAWKTDYTACHPRKDYHVYILHVVPISTHTHDRRKSIGKKRKQLKEKKIKEGKDKKVKNETGKKLRDKSKKRQAKKRKLGKEKRTI